MGSSRNTIPATGVVALWLVNLSAILVYNRGRLARVSTIHFARWVLLDDNRRVFFASNYDGSLESYMDDFINKVAFGLKVRKLPDAVREKIAASR